MIKILGYKWTKVILGVSRDFFKYFKDHTTYILMFCLILKLEIIASLVFL